MYSMQMHSADCVTLSVCCVTGYSTGNDTAIDIDTDIDTDTVDADTEATRKLIHISYNFMACFHDLCAWFT